MKKLLCCIALLFCFGAVLRAESTGEILTFPANPDKGFHWGYALYLPKTMDTSKKLPILFTMNDSGASENMQEAEQRTLERFSTNQHEKQIADGVGVPLLMPIIQRVRGEIDSHEWNRAVFVMQEGPLKRLDLQVFAMLQDAKKQLKKRGISTTKKFLVAGFSSAGGFGWRWTMLHPEKVLAAAIGGELYPMLPLETWKSTRLIYPVGVGDLKEFTEKKFNKNAWSKVPIFLTNGTQDYNDPLPYPDVFGEEERAISKEVLGSGTCQERWQQAQEILLPLAPNVQIHTYPNMEHETIWQDEIEFLKKHMNGGPLQAIAPTDTSDYPSILPVRVTALYFGQEAPLTRDREYLSDTDLLLQTRKKIPFWVRYKQTCEFDIENNNHIVLTDIPCRGTFRESDHTYLQVLFSQDQIKQLRSYKDRTFSVRSHHPEFIDIPENLTFTVK